ncbi:MAG: hypothetical protein WBD55_00670 [Dehalococcoidia bacterium]
MAIKTILVVSAALLMLLAVACGGSDSSSTEKSPYVQKNEVLLDALPVLPGAKRLETASSPYFGSAAGDEPLGYTTNATYAAPAAMTARDVIEFYALSLRGNWSYQARQVAATAGGEQVGRVLAAEFTQGAASISVNTHGMVAGGDHTFQVTVDYGGDR